MSRYDHKIETSLEGIEHLSKERLKIFSLWNKKGSRKYVWLKRYTVGYETDTRAYFSGVTILISLPTGTKIFNWSSTYLGNPPLLQLKTNSPFFGLLFLYLNLLRFTLYIRS